MMNDILKEEIAIGHVAVYINNIIIFTDNLTLHHQLTEHVLEKLWKNNLFVKSEKCKFEQPTVEVLNLIVLKNSIAMNEFKVKSITTWSTPMKVKHVQAFFRLTNFYQHFIKDFACLLMILTCKDIPWKWDEEQQHAFDNLKTVFTTTPILQLPNDTAPFCLETDVSDFATGTALKQLGEDKLWHSVAFLFKSLNEHKHNYEIYNKKLLTMICALEKYCHYLERHLEPVGIWLNHLNLTYFRQAQKLTCY